MKKFHLFNLSIAALCALPLTVTAELRISEAWIPEAPPAARMMAGYLEVHNAGDRAIAIVGAEIDGFDRVEIHRTVEEDGVARMRRQTHIEIAPGETVRFEPGGLHLMLMQPERRPAVGETMQAMLMDKDGAEWRFAAEVRPRQP